MFTHQKRECSKTICLVLVFFWGNDWGVDTCGGIFFKSMTFRMPFGADKITSVVDENSWKFTFGLTSLDISYLPFMGYVVCTFSSQKFGKKLQSNVSPIGCPPGTDHNHVRNSQTSIKWHSFTGFETSFNREILKNHVLPVTHRIHGTIVYLATTIHEGKSTYPMDAS